MQKNPKTCLSLSDWSQEQVKESWFRSVSVGNAQEMNNLVQRIKKKLTNTEVSQFRQMNKNSDNSVFSSAAKTMMFSPCRSFVKVHCLLQLLRVQTYMYVLIY